jgi:hypothetical protein
VCQFIVVLVAESRAGKLRAVTSRLTLSPVDNRSLAPYLEPGERVFSTTTGHCDCGTFLGSKRAPVAPRPLDGELEKLRKKGWSEAKIARWKSTQGPRTAESRADTSAHEREAWQRFLDVAPPLGILLHTYSGPLTGRIEIARVERVARAIADDAFLGAIEEDVIYRVTA